MLLKNIVLACFESRPSRIAVKKVCSLFLMGFKNAFFSVFSSLLLFDRFLKKYYNLLFSKPSLLNNLRNWEHRTEYISENWWSNFHKISVLPWKSHKKKIQKNYHNSLWINIRLSNFQDYFFSMSCINQGLN